MRKPVDIDSQHSRAIVKKIGERLRASLEEDGELHVILRKQIERLRQSENETQAKRSIIPDGSHSDDKS